MPRLRGAGVAVLGAFWLASSTAVAGPIEDAKAQIDASEYFPARASLDKAYQAGSNKPADIAEIYRLTGIVHAALNDPKAAQLAFQKCLALSPQTTLPAGTSPRISRPFAAAQEFLKEKKPLEIKTSTTADPPSVTVEIISDPMSMITSLQAVAIVDGKPEERIDQLAAPSAKIELPKGKRIDLRVVALDEKGNYLVEIGSKEVPIVILGKGDSDIVIKPPPPKSTPKPYKERPLYLKWWLWAGAAVVFGGAGAYFGYDVVRAQDELEEIGAQSANHTFDEAKDIEDRGRRSALFANIGLIAGGSFAITATVLYLTRPSRPTEERQPAKPISIAPMVSPQAAGLVLGGHF